MDKNPVSYALILYVRLEKFLGTYPSWQMLETLSRKKWHFVIQVNFFSDKNIIQSCSLTI